MTKERAPRPIVRLSGGRLSAVSAWDQELLFDMKDGTEFDLVRRSKRSAPHNAMYWVQLGAIVKATETFATADHFHTWIKVRLGYTAPIMGPKGQVIGMTVDSAAFDKMDQAAFGAFYEKACALIAAEMGIDMADVVPGWGL